MVTPTSATGHYKRDTSADMTATVLGQQCESKGLRHSSSSLFFVPFAALEGTPYASYASNQ